MLREDRKLLADLARACNDAGGFALEYMAGDLSTEAEEAYALRLVDIAEQLLAHAKRRKALVLNGEPPPLVIETHAVVVEHQVRELPPGSDTTSDGH